MKKLYSVQQTHHSQILFFTSQQSHNSSHHWLEIVKLSTNIEHQSFKLIDNNTSLRA